MTSLRKTAFVAGLLYLITYLAIPTIALYGPVLSDPDFIVSSGNDTGVLWGAVLELIVAFAIVGTGVVLFPVLRRQNEGVALGFVTSRLFEAGVITVGILSLLSIVTLQQEVGATAGADAGSLVITGQSLVATHDWSFLIGQTLLPGINALLLGSLFYKSRLVPRVIPLMGLIGGPLLISSAIGQVVGINEQYSAWSAIAVLPIFLWELLLGLWLVFKGFKTAPVIEAESRERRPRRHSAPPDGKGPGAAPGLSPASTNARNRSTHSSRTRRRRDMSKTHASVDESAADRAQIRSPLHDSSSAAPGSCTGRPTGSRGGRFGLSRPEAGSKFGMLRLTTADDGRASRGSRSSATTRTAPTSSPWP